MKNKILIIEDNLDIREGTAEILELAGYEVLTADNGKAGVEIAQNHLPSLIICDIMMPELDGYGVLYLLGKKPETAAIPFIFLTAKAERSDLRKGMDMGADDYLTKPFDDIELLNAIESRLNKKKQQEHFYSKGLQKLEDFASKPNQPGELKDLITHKKIRNIKKGQIIYYEGDPSQGIYLILEGSVKIVKLSKDGRELLTAIHHTDEYFGIYDALTGANHSETAEALENCSICLLNKDQVNEMINKYPSMAMQFINILSADIKQKDTQLVQLAYHSVRKRLADTLLRINEIHQYKNVFKISRDDLAGMAGMATETVSRTLSDFKEEKMIEKKGSEIHLINIEKMKNLKN